MLILDYRPHTVRAAAVLTNAYVAGTVIDNCEPDNQLIVDLDFTIGSLTDAQIKIEFSHDNTTFYQETFSAVSGGVSTESVGVHKLTASGKYRLAIPIKDRYVKISAIGTGTVTSSSLAIFAVIGQT